MTNIVVLVGNVGADPIARMTQGGTSITSLSVATSRRFKNGAGETTEQTEWHRITCFNGLGKICADYVRKGMKVSVQGRLHYTKWTDQDGTDRYGVEIYADEVNFLTKAPQAQEEAPAETKAPAKGRGKKAPVEQALELADDIPF